jgi:hypothetical protein
MEGLLLQGKTTIKDDYNYELLSQANSLFRFLHFKLTRC